MTTEHAGRRWMRMISIVHTPCVPAVTFCKATRQGSQQTSAAFLSSARRVSTACRRSSWLSARSTMTQALPRSPAPGPPAMAKSVASAAACGAVDETQRRGQFPR